MNRSKQFKEALIVVRIFTDQQVINLKGVYYNDPKEYKRRKIRVARNAKNMSSTRFL